MDKHTLEALNRLVNYVYDDEEKDYEGYEESDERTAHIFVDVKMVSLWVDEQMKIRNLI